MCELLHLVEHPLVLHKLTRLRDRTTGCKEFRELLAEAGALIAYEALRDVPLRQVAVETPMAMAQGAILLRQVAVVPILRAGLGMAEGVLRLLPAAKVGHVGLFRDEQEIRPVEYYRRLPDDIADRTVLIVDPMLATGGSAAAAIDAVLATGARDVRLCCLVAAPPGVRRLGELHPAVPIYAASLDERLDERAYIVPGLGDAGDRLYGTK